ncbi:MULTISPECIES: Rv3654c family TadE-like protein [Streptomyces]|uniref:Rv3654c family TadE-like protein n=1 Tax=Streptomyces TaxID=1883 RepID=UPI0010724114|nr:Rv3654c family TadE-like protein [Streptomyces sp. 4R-3d]TFI27647.1 helicase [Streptomyces sp. 4R-3d]
MNRDRGSATVWAAMATTALCAVFAVILAMGQAVVARHRAASAADLAALAAAGYALRGAEAACARAAEVAGAQGAEVVRCAMTGEIADVTARAGFGPYTPTVRSRAGPPDALPGAAPVHEPTRTGGTSKTRAGPRPAHPAWRADGAIGPRRPGP